jgi:hypothetical protein
MKTAVVDQITDVMFVAHALRKDIVTGAFAMFFLLWHPLLLAIKAVATGRGIFGVVLALTWTELIYRWDSHAAGKFSRCRYQ